MGNCLGRKSIDRKKHLQQTTSTGTAHTTSKFSYHDQVSPISTSISTQTQTPTICSPVFEAKQSSSLSNTVEKCDNEVMQDDLTSLLATLHETFTSLSTSSSVSSAPSLVPWKKFKADRSDTDTREENQGSAITLLVRAQDAHMGHLFSTNNEEDDQQVPLSLLPSQSEASDASSAPSLSESSLSSLSRSTTPFSSEDQLILSSSSSSTSSAILSFSPPLINHDRGRPSKYSDLIYLNRPWPKETFAFLLPMTSSRSPQDLLLNEFHQKITFHPCHQLRSVIDDVVQQQGIRIHRRSQSVLIEHEELECVHLKTLNKSDTPSLIFDDEHQLVHVTKHARWTALQPLISFTDRLSNLPDRFSTCYHCSAILSCSKLSQRLHPFLLVNATHSLAEKCLQAVHQKCTFGFISQKQSNQIEQTMIDTSKLTYSYDLDVEHRSFCFVLRVRSWPEEMRSTYERRSRLWPSDTAKLFDQTCFIRIRDDTADIPRKSACPSCEQLLSSPSKNSWSYSYAAIEAQLISQMSNEHRRFSSIAWNYINGKSQGQFPFVLFKHALFYFFEQCSFDDFTMGDVLSPLQLFTEFLFDRLQTSSFGHYINPDERLSTERISLEFLSMKLTPSDVKQRSIRCLSPSSAYLYHTFYLIQFQFNLFESLLSSKSNTMQTLLDLDTEVIRQLSLGVQAYKQQLDSSIAIKSHRSLTLDRLYRYQENNVQLILDYLPMLREKEPSLLVHSLWSMFIQYFNSFFDDLFFCEKHEHELSRIDPLNKSSF